MLTLVVNIANSMVGMLISNNVKNGANVFGL